MSKKITLLALAAACAAMFALPAAASAQEGHIEGITSFTGTGGAGSLAAAAEPTITCETTTVEGGKVDTGGTTGSMGLDFTGCHIVLLGITKKCKTAGASVANTIKTAGTFHVITVETGKAGVLVTPDTTVVECENAKKITVSGAIIGTITSPACGGKSKELKLSFAATGSTQNHRTYTGSSFDLTATTEGGSAVTGGLTTEVTLKSETEGTLNCT